MIRPRAALLSTAAFAALVVAGSSVGGTDAVLVNWVPATTVAPSGLPVAPFRYARDNLAGLVTADVVHPALGPGMVVLGLDGPRADGAAWFVADQAVDLGSVVAGPRRVIATGGAAGSAAIAFDLAALADGVRIDAIASRDGSELLFSIDGHATLPGGLAAGPADVIRLAGGAYARLFDARTANVPDGADVVGLEVAPDGRLLLAFDTAIAPSGTAFARGDIVAWAPAANPAWSLFYRPATVHAGLDELALRDFSVRFEPRPDILLVDGFEG